MPQEREASRAHVAALLRDHHLPQPDAQSNHIRMDLGAFRVRWELHTEFVTWSFSRPIEAAGFGEREPATALDAVPQEWLAQLPGQCLASMHLWVLPTQAFGSGSLVKHVLNEETLVGLHGGRWPWRGLHRLRAARRWLLAHGAAGRQLSRRGGWGAWCSGCWRSTPTAWPPCWACPPRARPPPCWPMPSANWLNWRRPSVWPAATRSRSCWIG